MKMKRILLLTALGLLVSAPALSQFPQMRRAQERMDQLRKAEAEREGRSENESALPKPKAARMNVDVRMTLSTKDHKAFDEAAAQSAEKLADGDSLFLYIKFNGKLGDYVLTVRDAENDDALRYLMFAEVAPAGDITALSHYVLEFTKEDLELREVKINLAPGAPGRNASIPVFVDVAGTRKAGVWNNELRLTNSQAIPRSPTDNLATAPIVLDLSGGAAKYPQVLAEYDSMILRGTTDLGRMPIPGSFYSLPLKNEVLVKLRTESIEPARFYFSGSGWAETGVSLLNPKRTRSVFAAYTYRREKDCFYGVAEVIQVFDAVKGSFATDAIKTQNGLPVPCTEIE